MNVPNDGDPAFLVNECVRGMSLRDYFAAQSMQVILHHVPSDNPDNSTPEMVAQNAYKVADAMLVARQKRLPRLAGPARPAQTGLDTTTVLLAVMQSQSHLIAAAKAARARVLLAAEARVSAAAAAKAAAAKAASSASSAQKKAWAAQARAAKAAAEEARESLEAGRVIDATLSSLSCIEKACSNKEEAWPPPKSKPNT